MPAEPKHWEHTHTMTPMPSPISAQRLNQAYADRVAAQQAKLASLYGVVKAEYPAAGLVECSGDPRQCSTLYCPDCVPGRYCGKGKPTPKVASAAVGVRGAAPHTAEVPPADRWAPGNTVVGDDYGHMPAGVFVAITDGEKEHGKWVASEGGGLLLDAMGNSWSYLAWHGKRTIIARPADAPDSIPHYPPRTVQLQPDDLKLGGMVGVAVVPPASPDGQAVERLAAWRAHAAELYRLQPGLGLGIADDDFDDLLGSDEALDAVREQLIAQAWGLA